MSWKSWKIKALVLRRYKCLGGRVLPPMVLLSLTSRGSKIKELNLMSEDWLCVMQKWGVGQKHNQQTLHIIGEMQPNYLGVIPLIHPSLLSLTSGGKKIKEPDDRRLTLRHAKLGVSINVLLAKIFCGDVSLPLSTPGLLSLTSGSLMTEDWLCVMQKLGGQKH